MSQLDRGILLSVGGVAWRGGVPYAVGDHIGLSGPATPPPPPQLPQRYLKGPLSEGILLLLLFLLLSSCIDSLLKLSVSWSLSLHWGAMPQSASLAAVIGYKFYMKLRTY